MSSEIFEAYAKLALEKGLIKNAEDGEKSKASKEALTSVEVLYGVMPNDTDKTHIMEQAHPESVVIAPAYDAINGLVENNIQRQNIIINQTMKPNRGVANGVKLAKKDLMLELVRISNHLDLVNESELVALADTCIEQVAKPVEKKAFAPLAIAAVIGGITAATWLYNHFSGSSKGLNADIKGAELAINDLQESSWYETKLTDEFRKTLSNIYARIENYKRVAAVFTSIVGTYNAETHEMIAQLATGPEGERIRAAFYSFYNESKKFAGEMSTYAEQLSNGGFQKNQKQEGGFWDSGIAGSLNEVLHGGKGLFSNEFDAASQALTRLVKGIQSVLETSKMVFNKGKMQAEKEAEFATEQAPIAPKSEAPAEAPAATEKSEEKGIMSGLTDAWHSLTGK